MTLVVLALTLSGTAVAPVAASDALAPLSTGVSASGTAVDGVLRSGADGCRLLLSDAETDAPIVSAKVTVRRFGKAAGAPRTATAAAGRFEGHYLTECLAPEEAAVVEVEGPKSDLLTFEAAAAEVGLPAPRPALPPLAPPEPAPAQPLPAVLGLLTLGAVLWRARRARPWAWCVALLLLVGARAGAHGPGEAAVGLPIAPGAEALLAQEIQFALGVRTARVAVQSFLPPRGPSAAGEVAAHSSPSVDRSAIVERDGKKLVFVRLAPERFVAREVELGWSNGQDVAVESGLQPGDLAVVSGAAFLRNGGAQRP